MELDYDDKTIKIENLVYHDRTKHFELDRHFIKEKLDYGLVCTPCVSTECQLVDV